jgi:hypothetical protein
VSARLEPKAAAQMCAQPAATLTQAISKTTDPKALQALGEELSAVSARLEPKEAAQMCAQPAATLSRHISKTTDPLALRSLAECLSAVSARLEPKEAARVCAQPAATLTQAISKTTDPKALPYLAEGLSAVLARTSPTTSRQRLLSVTTTVAGLGGPGLPVAALAAAQPAVEPVPSLPPQMLIDLLKHPSCVGESRRLVLDQLTQHFHRPFADQWEFVEYVHQQKLDLDLTTPPERPR